MLLLSDFLQRVKFNFKLYLFQFKIIVRVSRAKIFYTKIITFFILC